ncbi:MAG: D-amino-acid transaminase [Granulosicoccus sp.]
MSRTFYVNGEFVAEEDATISVLDRGFLFADAVYEVSTVLDGKLIDNKAHLKRLGRSLSELSMAPPCSDEEIVAAQIKLLELNNVSEGLLYLQVSRGVADRDFAYPKDAKSSLVMFTQEKNLLASPMAETGMHIISIPDLRWKRRDIKTVGLLAPSMGKQAAIDAGVHDAWMIEDGLVTEGTSNNAYIVTADKKIQTRHLGTEILSGITRQAVLRFAREAGYTVIEEPFTIEQARQASEAFVTSASTFVMPVVNIDGITLGDGTPGPVSRELRKVYIETAREHQDL